MNLVPSNQSMTMSSLEISGLVDSRHDKVKQSIERLVERGVIVQPPMGEVSENDAIGRPRSTKVYNLCKRDSLIVVAQLCPEFTAKIVDRWQELEERVSSNVVAMPNFSNPADAARAWAEQYEARQLAEQTKAQIGDRREATAMNTASQAVKKANKLEIELDRAKQYATVKRMQMIHHGQPFNWRMLKAASTEMGIPAIEIFDANYGTVKAYHAEVWMEVYALPIEEGRAAA